VAPGPAVTASRFGDEVFSIVSEEEFEGWSKIVVVQVTKAVSSDVAHIGANVEMESGKVVRSVMVLANSGLTMGELDSGTLAMELRYGAGVDAGTVVVIVVLGGGFVVSVVATMSAVDASHTPNVDPSYVSETGVECSSNVDAELMVVRDTSSDVAIGS